VILHPGPVSPMPAFAGGMERTAGAATSPGRAPGMRPLVKTRDPVRPEADPGCGAGRSVPVSCRLPAWTNCPAPPPSPATR